MDVKCINYIQVCQCVAEMHKLNVKPGHRFKKTVDLLSIKTNMSREKCALAIEREINNGLVEWGVFNSIGWLTAEGISILKLEIENNSPSKTSLSEPGGGDTVLAAKK